MIYNRTRYQLSVEGESVVVLSSLSKKKKQERTNHSGSGDSSNRPMSRRDIRRIRKGKIERKRGYDS